jgi:hypothetical protein
MSKMQDWRVTESIVYKVRARTAGEACDVIVNAENPDDYYWLCDGRSASQWPCENREEAG